MSHVDEGALHAYLDGALDEYPQGEATRIRAHLERCAECAARLEGERRVRQEASSILDLAVPRVEPPDFEELRAYVEATRSEPGRASARLYRLGWAASVVLAIGVGWLARDGQLRNAPRGVPSEPLLVPIAPPAERSAAPADEEAADSDPSTSDDAEERTETASSTFDDVASVAATRTAASDAPPAGRQSAPLADATVESARMDSGVPADPEALTAAGSVVPPPSVDPTGAANVTDVRTGAEVPEVAVSAPTQIPVDAGGDSAPPASSVAVIEEVAALPADTVDRFSRSDAVTEPAISPATSMAPTGDTGAVASGSAVAGLSAPTPRDPERIRSSAEPVTSRLQLGRAGPLGRTSAPPPPEDADAPWMIVPGLEVVSYATLAEATTPTGLHVVQALPDRGILDVYHLPTGMTPDELPPLEAGRTQVGGLRDGVWIVLRAAAEREILEELLARMMPSR